MLTLLAHERVKERHLVAQVLYFVRVLHVRVEPERETAEREHTAQAQGV